MADVNYILIDSSKLHKIKNIFFLGMVAQNRSFVLLINHFLFVNFPVYFVFNCKQALLKTFDWLFMANSNLAKNYFTRDCFYKQEICEITGCSFALKLADR